MSLLFCISAPAHGSWQTKYLLFPPNPPYIQEWLCDTVKPTKVEKGLWSIMAGFPYFHGWQRIASFILPYGRSFAKCHYLVWGLWKHYHCHVCLSQAASLVLRDYEKVLLLAAKVHRELVTTLCGLSLFNNISHLNKFVSLSGKKILQHSCFISSPTLSFKIQLSFLFITQFVWQVFPLVFGVGQSVVSLTKLSKLLFLFKA